MQDGSRATHVTLTPSGTGLGIHVDNDGHELKLDGLLLLFARADGSPMSYWMSHGKDGQCPGQQCLGCDLEPEAWTNDDVTPDDAYFVRGRNAFRALARSVL